MCFVVLGRISRASRGHGVGVPRQYFLDAIPPASRCYIGTRTARVKIQVSEESSDFWARVGGLPPDGLHFLEPVSHQHQLGSALDTGRYHQEATVGPDVVHEPLGVDSIPLHAEEGLA